MTTPPSADTLRDRPGPRDAPPPWGLYLLFGPGPARGWIARLGRTSVCLGREVDPDRDIRLEDARVSKRQAEIQFSPMGGRYWLTDLDSTNGTFVHGTPITRHLLRDGDLIRAGDTVLRFARRDPEAEPIEPRADGLVGHSPALRRTLARVTQLAATSSPVLVVGETGVGKELICRALHRASQRPGQLCAINCAAIANELAESELFGHAQGAFSGAHTARPGLFRAARGGTVFLDEVGELSPAIQAKLLRALDDMRIRPVGEAGEVAVDVKVVAATNRDLASAAQRGEFRADLYARLAESTLAIAPLRERLEDIEPLWNHFIDTLGSGQTYTLTGATFEAMAAHDWPLNVREVRQLARHVLLARPEGGVLLPADLPAAMHRPAAKRQASATNPTLELSAGQVPTAQQLRRLVEELQGNVKEVAAFLGKDRTQIYRWLKRYGIDPAAYRGH